MAIDIERENLLTLAQAARHLPCLRGDRKIHVSTLYRWISCGVRGVRLESVRLGRTVMTSREALQRFADRLSLRDSSSRQRRSSADREATEEELDRHGL